MVDIITIFIKKKFDTIQNENNQTDIIRWTILEMCPPRR